VKRNRPEQAVAILEELLRENPRYAAGYRMLAGVYGSVLGDTLKSRQYLDQYDSMMKGAK
jgi:predicted Zn-dependent protease